MARRCRGQGTTSPSRVDVRLPGRDLRMGVIDMVGLVVTWINTVLTLKFNHYSSVLGSASPEDTKKILWDAGFETHMPFVGKGCLRVSLCTNNRY
jgi:hypothetical protein